MNSFTSPVDGCHFLYQIENGNLSYKIDGTDWQDFCPQDRRAYADYGEAHVGEMNELIKSL